MRAVLFKIIMVHPSIVTKIYSKVTRKKHGTFQSKFDHRHREYLNHKEKKRILHYNVSQKLILKLSYSNYKTVKKLESK